MPGDAYYFDDKLIDFKESEIKILDLVSDGKLKVVNIPIIEDGKRLEQLIEAFDNLDEGIKHYMEKNHSNYISILAPSEKVETAIEGAVSYYDYIMDDLEFNVLYEYGQDPNCDHSLVEIQSFNIFFTRQ